MNSNKKKLKQILQKMENNSNKKRKKIKEEETLQKNLKINFNKKKFKKKKILKIKKKYL
jgi:hypothetical protein